MAPAIIRCCISTAKWMPVLFITSVIVWSYYAYVIQMCLFTITNIGQKVIYLILYHPFFMMLLWSYWKTIFTDCAPVPKEFYLTAADKEQLEQAQSPEQQQELLTWFGSRLPIIQCRTGTGSYRYCEKCQCLKPDRAHHCSACGRCILKMDHHCPWVNNCVCFSNYKFFILFLGYALVYCIYVAATSLQFFIQFWTDTVGRTRGDSGNASNLHLVFLTIVGALFAISLISLFVYHTCCLVMHNQSTLEAFRAPIFPSGPDKNGFSIGRHGNFQEVFGNEPLKWFLPIFTSCGDGVAYECRALPSAAPPPNNYHSMEAASPPVTVTGLVPSLPSSDAPSTVVPSFGDGVSYPVRSVDEDHDSLLGQRQRWMEEGNDTESKDSLPARYGSSRHSQQSGYNRLHTISRSYSSSASSYSADLTSGDS